MKKEATNRIEKAAELALKNLESWKLPVDPIEIAKKEEIELLPDDYGEGFDGRIRFLNEIERFAISYRKVALGRSEGRVRFTIAHELGHYYLHRDYLLAGKCHTSTTNFASNDQMEFEADSFAAALLMPMDLFRQRVKRLRSHVADLNDLRKMASNDFRTSITSTVRRYCQSDVEPCGAIFSRAGTVQWAQFSQDMSYLGMGFFPFGQKLPEGSVTAKMNQRSDSESSGAVDPWVWFDSPKCENKKLWEESMVLGSTGVTLTYLTLQ